MANRKFVVEWDAPRVEPVRRMVAGRFGWAVHRFPIKGGISLQRATHILMREAAVKENRLLRRLKKDPS